MTAFFANPNVCLKLLNVHDAAECIGKDRNSHSINEVHIKDIATSSNVDHIDSVCNIIL